MLDQVKEEQVGASSVSKGSIGMRTFIAFVLLLTVCHAAKHLLVEVEDEDLGTEEDPEDVTYDTEYNPDLDKPRRQQNKRLGFLHAQFGKRG